MGGLGGSPYLYEYLKQKHAGDNITVLQSGGMKPYVNLHWTAPPPPNPLT